MSFGKPMLDPMVFDKLPYKRTTSKVSTICPCGKIIDEGPTCKSCDELVCQACADGIADAIRKEDGKCK